MNFDLRKGVSGKFILEWGSYEFPYRRFSLHATISEALAKVQRLLEGEIEEGLEMLVNDTQGEENESITNKEQGEL